MKIVTNFLLRKSRKADDGKSSVCVRITYLGNRIELATGIYSSTDHWDTSRQRIKEKIIGARVDNERLDRIKIEIQDIFNQLRSINEDFDTNTIKRKLLNIQESNSAFPDVRDNGSYTALLFPHQKMISELKFQRLLVF